MVKINSAKFAIKHPVSMCMVVLALIVFGIQAIFSAPVELMPDIEIPMLIVATPYPGAGPEDVESLVSREIEGAVASLRGVKSITSTSNENMSIVMLEMNYGTNMDIAHTDLQKQIGMISNSLPDEAQNPIVIEIDINMMMDTVSISATSTADLDLLYYVEEEVIPQLEKLPGVASVNTSGGNKDYISIELNEELLRQYKLSMSTVISTVSSADFSMPLGNAERADETLTLQGGVKYDTVESLKSIPITLSAGNVIRLSDIAKIYSATEEQTSISRYNGQENVNVGVQKRQSSSTLSVARDVKRVVDEINNQHLGISLEIVNSADDQIMSSISTVVSTLFIAVILAMLVLFIFMGDWKASIIIGTSIPVSLLTTLTFMSALGFSFNIISLTSLIIAIGNMVDNSVVVLDSCFAVQKKTKTIEQAAIEGTQSVISSQIAGTLANIVTFLPLALIAGMSGQMFKPLALTIVLASLSSVLSALTLVPLLFAIIKPKEKEDIFISRVLDKMKDKYAGFLQSTFPNKKVVVLCSVAMLVISILFATTLDFELMTAADEGTITIEVDLKPGLEINRLNEMVQPLEEMVAEHPDVERYTLTGGGGGSFLGSGKSATISVFLRKDRQVKTDELVEQWQRQTEGLTGYNISISSTSQTTAMGAGSNVEIVLEGIDRDDLTEASTLVENVMNNHPSLTHISSTATANEPRAEIKVDPLKAVAVGMTPTQVVNSIYPMVSGNKAASITQNGREYDIRVEFPRDKYRKMSDISSITITTPTGAQVPLLDIATIEYTTSPQSIYRKDNQYQITISGQPTLEAERTAADDVRASLAGINLPQGVSIAESVEDVRMVEEFTSIIIAILTAVLLMFMVMAMQFESARFSFVIMICIPFSMIGAFLLMRITGITFSMTSLMGFLLLFGTVINNGILFIDTADDMQANGMEPHTALVNAGMNRMRPILMTSCVTIFSMIPESLAIGEGAEVMQGMAIVIVGGLVASTILTLLLLPTFYLLFGGGTEKHRRKLRKMRDIAEPVELEVLPT